MDTKRFTVHTMNCPDDCTYNWTAEQIKINFDIDVSSLELGDYMCFEEINEFLTNITRDK